MKRRRFDLMIVNLRKARIDKDYREMFWFPSILSNKQLKKKIEDKRKTTESRQWRYDDSEMHMNTSVRLQIRKLIRKLKRCTKDNNHFQWFNTTSIVLIYFSFEVAIRIKQLF